MPQRRKHATIALILAVVLTACGLAAAAAGDLAPNGSRAQVQAGEAQQPGGEAQAGQSGGAPPPGGEAQAPEPRNPPLIAQGPGGRTRLVRWTRRNDGADRGLALDWQRGGFGGTAVDVPNVVSPAYSGPAGVRNYEGSVAWYRTTFTAPAAGTYAVAFQSANFLAQVWIDGRGAGSHRGAYLPFEARARLGAGSHTVVVRIDWRNPEAQAAVGFHRTWFNWGGLGGEVSVRPIGPSEISVPALRTTLSPDAPEAAVATVRVHATVRNDGPARTITLQGALAHGEQRIALEFAPLMLAHGQSALAVATAHVPAPALWSPAHPTLYDLTLGVPGESSYSARVGLRELSWNGGQLSINGRRLRLHGATVQEDVQGRGDALGPGDEDALVRELQRIGANAARAQHPLDAALLERLDAAGILVWQGIGPVEGAGNWMSSSPPLLAEAERQARSAATDAAVHPSIIAWNLVDELAQNGRDAAELRYVQSVTGWLHAHDPGRLVAIDVWGDHPPRSPGPIYAGADAIAETDYSGWYDNPRESVAQLRAEVRTRLARMERTFPGKVLVISEFGAESNALNATGSAGGFGFQSRLLEGHIDVYRTEAKLSGMMIWVLRDYALNPRFQGGSIHFVLPRLRLIEGLNQKGLFTYSGQPKPAASVVRRLFGALPAD